MLILWAAGLRRDNYSDLWGRRIPDEFRDAPA
jgi:hypothetical protein